MPTLLACDLIPENRHYGIAWVRGPVQGAQNAKRWYCVRIGSDADGRDIGGGMFGTAAAYNTAQFGHHV